MNQERRRSGGRGDWAGSRGGGGRRRSGADSPDTLREAAPPRRSHHGPPTVVLHPSTAQRDRRVGRRSKGAGWGDGGDHSRRAARRLKAAGGAMHGRGAAATGRGASVHVGDGSGGGRGRARTRGTAAARCRGGNLIGQRKLHVGIPPPAARGMRAAAWGGRVAQRVSRQTPRRGGAARATRSRGIVSKRFGRPPLNECVVDASSISVLAEFRAVAVEVRTPWGRRGWGSRDTNWCGSTCAVPIGQG